MAIEVYSPHSGHPVKAREEDVGRAIRDEGGRVFYVLPRLAGGGHYGSLTRAGSENEEARYDDLARRIEAGEFVPEPVEPAEAGAGSANAGAAKAGTGRSPRPHDATGRRRISPTRLAIFILALLVLLAAASWLANWWFDLDLLDTAPPAPRQRQLDEPPATQPTTQPAAWRAITTGGSNERQENRIAGFDPVPNMNTPVARFTLPPFNGRHT